MKGVQGNEEVDEDEVEDMVILNLLNCSCHKIIRPQLVKAKEQQDKEYIENAKEKKSSKAKVVKLRTGTMLYLTALFFDPGKSQG